MAISIDWETRIITVPRADMTLIQSTPVEIRELNLNDFRLNLKDLEDGEDGIVYPDTHSHNTEVLLGGIVYARVIEIINGYTVTFENGTYAVNLVGANSNVGDVVNLNFVSIRSSNSAGLISNQAIEFSSFEGSVTIDINNITGKAVSGTIFPTGTLQAPVDNLSDLKLIAIRRGLSRINVVGDLPLTNEASWERFTIVGQGPTLSTILLYADTVTTLATFENCTISGDTNGAIQAVNCSISNLTGLGDEVTETVFTDCGIDGDMILSTGATAGLHFVNSHSDESDDNFFYIDGAGADCSVVFRGWVGGMKFINFNFSGLTHSIDMLSGHIELDSSCTSGDYIIRGTGDLIDDSTSGATVNSDGLISKQTIADAVWDLPVGDFSSGTMGEQIRHILKFTGQGWWVSKDGSDSNNGASPGTAFLTLTYAISQASAGDVITVKAGTYDEEIDINKRGLEVHGEIGAIITCSTSGTCITVSADYCRVKLLIAKPEAGQIGFSIDSLGSSIDDCLVSGGGTGMVIQSGTTGTIIKDFRIDEGVTDTGLDIKGNHNEFNNVTIHGGGITDRAIYLSEAFSDDNEFSNCVIWNTNIYDIDIVPSSNDNYFHSCGYITLNDEGTDNTFTSINISGGTGNCDAEAIADAVWDDLLLSHQNGGSFGEVMQILLEKADTLQHTGNLNTELLKNKPNNP